MGAVVTDVVVMVTVIGAELVSAAVVCDVKLEVGSLGVVGAGVDGVVAFTVGGWVEGHGFGT